MGGAPRQCHVAHPCARVVPSAHIESYTFLASRLYGVADGGVSFLLVEHGLVEVGPVGAAAEVYLYEVKVECLEEEVGVLLVVAVEPHVVGYGVVAPEVAARVSACVGVNAGFQSLAVYVVDQSTQTVGEAHGMY